MPTVITSNADTITADAVTDYTSRAESGNRVQHIIGVANPSAVLRVAGLRTGTLTLQFASETASRTAETLHATAGRVFRVVSAERPSVNMYYIMADGGGITRRLNREGHWTLTVDFQEVTV
jgi:hypothetical protein